MKRMIMMMIIYEKKTPRAKFACNQRISHFLWKTNSYRMNRVVPEKHHYFASTTKLYVSFEDYPSSLILK